VGNPHRREESDRRRRRRMGVRRRERGWGRRRRRRRSRLVGVEVDGGRIAKAGRRVGESAGG